MSAEVEEDNNKSANRHDNNVYMRIHKLPHVSPPKGPSHAPCDPAKDTCQEIGLFNGYGLGQTHTKQTCFSSHALAEALVEDWFRQKLQVMDLPTALCYWNLGLKINNCQYERNYYGITK